MDHPLTIKIQIIEQLMADVECVAEMADESDVTDDLDAMGKILDTVIGALAPCVHEKLRVWGCPVQSDTPEAMVQRISDEIERAPGS